MEPIENVFDPSFIDALEQCAGHVALGLDIEDFREIEEGRDCVVGLERRIAPRNILLRTYKERLEKCAGHMTEGLQTGQLFPAAQGQDCLANVLVILERHRGK